MNLLIGADVIKDRKSVAPRAAAWAGGGAARQSAAWLRRYARMFLLFSPSLIAFVYFGFVAADRYVSEAQFVVRTAAKPASASFGALLQMTGLGRAQDEIFSVLSFMKSRSAVEGLAERLPLSEIYGRPEADAVARYPSLFYGATEEELHKYLNWMITTNYISTSGITTLKVQAFRPRDAQAVAALLLDLGEQTVNRMNDRIRDDAVRVAEDEVSRNEKRMIEAQVAITKFRNAELMIDPSGSSIVVSELIARLSAELAQTQAQIREMSAGSPNNPMLSSLNRRTDALQGQIAQERRRISTDSEGLADKLAVYERLVLDREFAKQTLSAAARSLEVAQQDGRRQQLYLERIVEPAVPDYAIAPERIRMIATSIAVNVILLLVGWLIFAGIREHAVQNS